MGCHKTKKQAIDQLTAINISEYGKREETFTPNARMRAEARRGLAWRKEVGRGGTRVGVARARDISNGRDLPLSTVMRMRSYFARHEVDKKDEGLRPGEKGYPSNGKIAWCLTHDTEILLADGTLETIGNIVNNKMNVEVMSKQDDGSIKPAKIINWLKLPSNKDEFMVLKRGESKSNECGVVSKPKLYATKEHPIFTGHGYTKMENLTNNHKVAVVEEYLENHICKNEYKYSMQEINYIRKVDRHDDRNHNKFNFKYDLTIENTHNFIANGVIVHNCHSG